MEESKEEIVSLAPMEIMESTESDNYYDSYDRLDVHKLMLQDIVKNEAYRMAIMNNKDLFEGSVVLDLGAGTGILSVLCAQAGAKKVYAVEASKIFEVAEETVKENKCEDVVQVIHAPIEHVELPEKVDIIVAEWMGFYLLHEGMITSLIYARDKFLVEDGLMFPENATLYSAPCSVPSYFDFWKDPYGVSMEHFAEKLRESVSERPITEAVHPKQLLSKGNLVVWLDLCDITLDDIKKISTKTVAVANKTGQFQGICIWFECSFPSKSELDPVVLSTEPGELITHWKQTTIVLPNSYEVQEATPIAYELTLRRSRKNYRKYTIEFEMLDENEVVHPENCGCHFIKCKIVTAYLRQYENNEIDSNGTENTAIEDNKIENDEIKDKKNENVEIEKDKIENNKIENSEIKNDKIE